MPSSFFSPMIAGLFWRPKSCPSEQQLAEYADQQLIASERNLVAQHLVTCRICLQQVGFLVRSGEPGVAVPPELLRAARLLPGRSQPSRSAIWRPVAVLATAAVVIFSSWSIVQRHYSSGPSNPPPVHEQAALEKPVAPTVSDDTRVQLRGSVDASLPTILIPKADATIDVEALRFEWQAVSSAEYYDVELLTESGDLVWKQQTTYTSIKMPQRIGLQHGRAYYVWVVAHSPATGFSRSAPVRFVVG